MKKVIKEIETVNIEKLGLGLYVAKTGSSTICELLVSQYFDKKEKHGWLPVNNCCQVLVWHESRKEAIEYMMAIGFDVYCFDIKSCDNEERERFLEWLINEKR